MPFEDELKNKIKTAEDRSMVDVNQPMKYNIPQQLQYYIVQKNPVRARILLVQQIGITSNFYYVVLFNLYWLVATTQSIFLSFPTPPFICILQ